MSKEKMCMYGERRHLEGNLINQHVTGLFGSYVSDAVHLSLNQWASKV